MLLRQIPQCGLIHGLLHCHGPEIVKRMPPAQGGCFSKAVGLESCGEHLPGEPAPVGHEQVAPGRRCLSGWESPKTCPLFCYLPKMLEFTKWVNSNFLTGFTVPKMVKTHGWPESLV
jgi:hypothetical protein